MNFNKHSEINGHAFLSPSTYHWIRYNDEKLEATVLKAMAAQRGTDLHNLASECVRLGVKMPRTKNSFNRYVNDAIGYRMSPEVTLFYSYNAYGTADAICFRDNLLRIHDLKTGVSPASMDQLEVYAALFCLEYKENPESILIELRKYQLNEVLVYNPPFESISGIMEKIVRFDKRIQELRELEY